MNLRRKLSLLPLGVILMVAGCAETHKVMSFGSPDPEGAQKVWPALPDEPRYRYVGELIGEENFIPDKQLDRSKVTRFFEWLVGFSGQSDAPVVLQRPQGGMIDAEGRIYITDISRSAVYVFDKPAGQLEVWQNCGMGERFAAPIGIAQGMQGEVLVADAELHTVFRLDSKGNPLGEFGREILKRPTGLAIDSRRGAIYVADTHAHDIKVFNNDGSLQRVIGQRGEGEGQFNFPTHLTFNKDKLYVTDTLNSRVQIFDTNGNMIQKFGERGLSLGNMVRPKGIAVDSRGNIYVIESLHDNLLVFNSEGDTLLAIGGSGKGVGEFYLPAGVWIDDQDQIYIADMFNGRVVILKFLGSSQ